MEIFIIGFTSGISEHNKYVIFPPQGISIPVTIVTKSKQIGNTTVMMGIQA